ncbi:hypothetical protein PRK78_002942 [Emydomyces testavorans]|uniref:Vacuolar protein sorting-associated protein 62 n=1 Tax=Emydomyces testavorans TaxID=2070801 RepID=A0AAF0IH00_9EURO|nr:hypothetical protein PRK78_002942 [Emydomyces testavorans]
MCAAIQWCRGLAQLTLLSILGLGVIRGVHTVECDAAALPDYVLKYGMEESRSRSLFSRRIYFEAELEAPLIWTHSQDPYQPSDIAGQVAHTIPQVKYKPVQGAPSPLTLDNLDALNKLGGTDVFLTSKEGIRARPSWFKGVRPNANGKTEGAALNSVTMLATGKMPFLFVNEFEPEKDRREHNMIRFQNGQPQAIWYSQHSSGQAFEWDAVNKRGERPIGFSANGSHAVYATEGSHDHTIPGIKLPIGLLTDECDKGFLWDPTLSTYTFKYDRAAKSFSTYNASTPINWLNFDGQWGDEQLPDNAEGQINLFGQRKYASGPNGPKFKDLDRKGICPSTVLPCFIRQSLAFQEDEGRELRRVLQPLERT